MIVDIKGEKIHVVKGNPEYNPYTLLVNSFGLKKIYCFNSFDERKQYYQKYYKNISDIVKCTALNYM